MIYPEFEEFCACLGKHGARFLLVGGHAVGFHARPRLTKDIDFYVEPTAANARRVVAAISEFFGSAVDPATEDHLAKVDHVVQLGVVPRRIDVITSISGIDTFAKAWLGRVEASLGAAPVAVIGLEDLIVNKRAAGRPRDREDLRALERAAASSQGTKPLKAGSKAKRTRRR